MRKYITDYSSKAFYLCIFIIYFINFIPLTLSNLEIFFLLRYGSNRNYSPQSILIYFSYVLILTFASVISSFELKIIYKYINAVINKFFYWISSSLIVISFSLIAFITKLILFVQYGLYSRHSDIFRIQSTGVIGIAHTFAFYYLLNYLLFNTIYYFSLREKRSNLQKISFLCALFGFAILINSSLSAFSILTLILLNFTWLKKLDFLSEVKSIFTKSKLKLNFIFLIIITIFIATFTVSIGFINKSIATFQNALGNIYETIFLIFIRLTTHSDSLLRLITGCDIKCDFFNPFSGLFWRLSYFLDQKSYIGEILTPNRINLLNTFSAEYVERFYKGGSSPGILASFLLGEPILLTFIFVLLISGYFIFNMRLMFRSIRFSIKSIILYFMVFTTTLSSPLNYLLIFTPNLITILFLSVYAIKINSRDKLLNNKN